MCNSIARTIAALLAVAAFMNSSMAQSPRQMAAAPPPPGYSYCPPWHSGYFHRWSARHYEWKRRQQAKWWGYPEEFEEAPLGHFLYEHMSIQVANGVLAQQALYEYDFVAGSDQLNQRGRRRLARILELMPSNFSPLKIAPTWDNPELNEARRVTVMNEINRGSFPVPIERIVIGPSLSRPLPGGEAVIIHENHIQRTRNRARESTLNLTGSTGPASSVTGGSGSPSP